MAAGSCFARRAASHLQLGLAALCCILLATASNAVQVDGVVTDTTTAPVEGVAVVFDGPVVVEVFTDANGMYSANVDAGSYTVSFEDVCFEALSEPLVVPQGGPVTLDAVLTPVASDVIVTTEIQGVAAPGAVLTATATVDACDGSNVQSILWSQSQSVTVDIQNADMLEATVTLPNTAAYKDELITVLQSPPISEDDLPPNVTLPEGGFVGGLQDRYQVVGINPFALEEAGLVTLQVTVTTDTTTVVCPSDGPPACAGELEIHAALPWKVATGLNNVPLGRAVLLYAKDLPDGTPCSYDWSLGAPGSSGASLTDATTQSPWFTPDVAGAYTLSVCDVETTEPVTIEVWAGSWVGAITGQDQDGHPVAEDCTVCHREGGLAPDNFTPWSQTGHARIFSDLLNTNANYNAGCFGCHSVGYDPDVENGGFDDAADFQDFLAWLPQRGAPDPNLWTEMLADYPESARLANAQCENCHGPANAFHANSDIPAITLSSETCATCHGEPLRHARYQQWQLSRHSNYELAGERGGSGECSRCHTANGFLAWLPVLLGDEPGDPTDPVQVTWSADEVHPQTCATCHDPHSTGTTSGVPTDATVRISDNTPLLLAGFVATDVGRGALCMTCHNTRRGLRNDETFADSVAANDETRAPHPGAQADMLMGQNLYLVDVPQRSRHSLTAGVADTCVTCHMEATPPPADLSYNQSGSNHTFFPRPDICGECHVGIPDASIVQGEVQAKLDTLQADQEDALLDVIAAQTARGRVIDLNGQAQITDAADVQELVFTESRGRQAITVTLPTGTFGPNAVNSVDVLQNGTILGELYDFADPRIAKAGWNLGVVSADGSLGVHNPSLANEVLDASIEALQMVPEPGSLASQLAAAAALGWLASRRRRRTRG